MKSAPKLDNAASVPAQESGTLPYWQTLSVAEQAFVVAYVENSYSIKEASLELAISYRAAVRMLRQIHVKRAVVEVQEQLYDIDFLNEKYVRAQLLKLYPKLIGEEEIPFVTNLGEQMSGFKFFPEAALKVLEYIAPKKSAPSVVQISNSSATIPAIDMAALQNLNEEELEQLEELLAKAREPEDA